VDLDAYFDRIRYTGDTKPTLATLHALSAAHTQAIPFENLDVLRNAGIDLAPDAVFAKLVRARRGGYCFEQNTLFLYVLEALGYQAAPISARVRLGRTRAEMPARTHVFVRVEIEGASYLADVGVGGLSLTCALRLVEDVEQPTPHETRRIVRGENGNLYHQARYGTADWFDVCEFTLEQMPPIDREVANWYTSAHPGSHFKSRLVVARGLPDGGRASILNRDLTIRGRGGAIAHTQALASPAQLLEALAEHFHLHFPPGTTFACPALDWPQP
jgi:N-hydroxyarylamine O-acetyltransferase